jgi:geranylgeranyl diphosphate synthase type II
LLREAIHYATFPGGRRIRPNLALAVFDACAGSDPGLALHAGAAIELLHCASLAYDDLPCFDDAERRRGRLCVHTKFGQALAVLAGNALVVMAFDVMSRAPAANAQLKIDLIGVISDGVGAASGITAGQAWEQEPNVDLATYHRAKTGTLFEAAVRVGALAAGADAEAWAPVGLAFGEAYQVADDVCDVLTSAKTSLKTAERDDELDRPNAVLRLGVSGASYRLHELLLESVRLIPACAHRDMFGSWLASLAETFAPSQRPQYSPSLM